MSFEFNKLQTVSETSNCLVFGYIHETEKLLALDVPDLVTCICIFYYHQFEHFTKHGPGIQLNEDKNIATVINSICDINTVYGNIEVDASKEQTRYIWTFKILYVEAQNDEDMYIGIDSSNREWIEEDFSDECSESYTYYSWGTDKTKYSNSKLCAKYSEYNANIETNDTIKMEVNTTEKSLKYYINGEDQGVAFDNLELDGQIYHLAIAMNTENTCVELLQFEQY